MTFVLIHVSHSLTKHRFHTLIGSATCRTPPVIKV